MFRTQAHERYYSPSRTETQSRFLELGFDKPYSYDLVRDLANAYSFEMEGKKKEESLLPLDINMFDGTQEEKENQLQYHRNVQEFVCSLDYSSFSGISPLEKAASIIAVLSSQEGGEGEEGEGQPLPIFTGEKSPKEISEKLEEDVQNMDNHVEVAKLFAEKNGQSVEMQIALLTEHEKKVLSLVAQIGSRGKVKSQRTSAKVSYSQMTEYGQSSRVNVTSRVLPTFGYKFATKQLPVRKPEQSSKQMLIVLLDISGSMNNNDKQMWVKALLLDRAKAVYDNKAELCLVPFGSDADLDSIVFIRNKAEAKSFIELLRKNNIFTFNQGGTDIEDAHKTTENAIKDGKFGKHKDYQIVIMNDGDDSVNKNYRPTVVTHGFILGSDNVDLQTVITRSGGHFERFL